MHDFMMIEKTKKPHTFFIGINWTSFYEKDSRIHSGVGNEMYKKIALEFIEENKKLGLNPMLKVRYVNNPTYYITFRSKHDAMAFKLTWT